MKARGQRGGFSLIEVVIALGITTFAITTILAMMPIGLTALREAMDDTMEARMIRKVSADLQMSPFSQFHPDSMLFDLEGEQVTDVNDARYRVSYTNRSHGADTFPGASPEIGSDLLSVEVTIHRVNGEHSVPLGSFPVTISRSDNLPE